MLRPRPANRRPRQQSPKQMAATQRNFRIFRLHGLHSSLGLLTGERRAKAEALVDEELTLLGAKTASQRAVKRDLERDAEMDRLSLEIQGTQK